MQEFDSLIREGKHVEFVEQLNELEKKIADAKKEEERKILEKQKKEKLNLCKNYYQTNKEILSLEDKELVDVCCALGVYLAKEEKLKTTQIRKILERFNRIEEGASREKFEKREIIKLKPILAYTSARNKETRELIKILDSTINKINNFDEFQKMCDFMRGVLAYHKLAGGGD